LRSGRADIAIVNKSVADSPIVRLFLAELNKREWRRSKVRTADTDHES
jgi:hypothetical protein